MRKAIPILILWLSIFYGHAQILQPTKWSTQTTSKNASAGEVIELIFNVAIDKDWYLYSSEFPCEDGPIETTFTFEPAPGYELVGGIIPINPTDKYDEIFECDVKIFK
ncbi:MAG TPA: disulfide bond formation protein DsbD, partial [Cyclobacteriaceae bacterium]|nr:disulfide bond formation protein DsbD [Cyclobacteriaceae bacterium]